MCKAKWLELEVTLLSKTKEVKDIEWNINNNRKNGGVKATKLTPNLVKHYGDYEGKRTEGREREMVGRKGRCWDTGGSE